MEERACIVWYIVLKQDDPLFVGDDTSSAECALLKRSHPMNCQRKHIKGHVHVIISCPFMGFKREQLNIKATML